MSTTVTYKGNTLTTATNQTKVLETAGKYMEDDITVTDVTELGTLLIVDTEDEAGGTVRSITGKDEVLLKTTTIEPTTSTQVIEPNEPFTTFSYTFSVSSHTSGARTSTSSISGGDTTLLTYDDRYRFTGTIEITGNDSEIIEVYDFDETNTLSSTPIVLYESSESYIKSFTLWWNGSRLTLSGAVDYGVTGTFGSVITINIYEPTVYDGFSQVTVNAFDGYDQTTIKNFIERTSAVTSFELPNGISRIGDYAFANCTFLTDISIPATVTYIGNRAFLNCSALQMSSFPSNITNLSDYAFSGCSALALTSLSGRFSAINSYTFADCINLALTSLPEGIINIYSSAFANCYKLALTTLPSTVTYIGQFAFQRCEGLTSIYCNGAITTLNINSFNGNSTHPMSLTSVRFPNMVTSSLSYAFGNSTAAQACQFLELADIGSTASIAANAFANCYALETLVLRKSDAICTLSNVSAFLNTPMRGYNSKTGTVYVPSALISTYQTATNWSTLYNDGTITFAAIEGSDYEI